MNLVQMREARRQEFRAQQKRLYPHREPDLHMGRFDVDAGITMKKTAFDSPSAFFVGMYDMRPGEYYNEFGYQVSKQLAAEAGFDVELNEKARLKMKRTAEVLQLVDEEFDPEMVKPLAERGGFKVIALSMGRAIVRDPDGNQITPSPVTVEQAKKILSHFVPQEDDDASTIKADGKKKE